MDIPLVLLQAMALQCPIIVSNLPSLLELLERPVGVSVPPDDPSALAEAIVSLLKDPSRREAMGIEGRSFVEQRFLATQMAAAYERLYISLADGRAA